MENTRTPARVAYALISFAENRLAPGLGAVPLRDALKPGTSVERYGRRWFMANWTEDDEWFVGKLAFEQATEQGLWDFGRNDVREFTEFGVPVQAVPFVVDKDRLRVAFELRGQTVKPGSFQGSFRSWPPLSGLKRGLST